MRKRKNYTMFNAYVIGKREISVILAITLAIIFVIPVLLESSFINRIKKSVLLAQIPMLNLTNYKSDTASRILDIFKPEHVIAESLPMISKSNTTNELIIKQVTEAAEEKRNTEATPAPPPDTFPILNSPIVSKNLEVRNETTYLPDYNSLLYAPLSFSSPEFLIVHTHASESYKNDNNNYYYETDSDRTTDTSLNVVRVGEELSKELQKYGFKVTHAKDINDYPSYNQSYNKTLEVIKFHLNNNPKIQIVIDLHRDSVVRADGTKLKFASRVEGENVSQVMIVCGTNQAGLENDTWQENLKFALKLQNYMENNYPGLARPLNLRQERFNTHATYGSLIIEVGASGNTLGESLSTAKYLAKTINEVVKPYR